MAKDFELTIENMKPIHYALAPIPRAAIFTAGTVITIGRQLCATIWWQPCFKAILLPKIA